MKWLVVITALVVCVASAQPCDLLVPSQRDEEAYGPFSSVTYNLTPGDLLEAASICHGLVFPERGFDRVLLSWSGYPAQALAYRVERQGEWSGWRAVTVTFDEDGLRNGVISLEGAADAFELLLQDPMMFIDLRLEFVTSSDRAFDWTGHRLFLQHTKTGWSLWQLEAEMQLLVALSDDPDDLFLNVVTSPAGDIIAMLKVDSDDPCMPCIPSALVLAASTGETLAEQQLETSEGSLVWYDRLVFEQSAGAGNVDLIDIEY